MLLVATAAFGAPSAAAGTGGVKITINRAPGPYLAHDDLLAIGAVDQPPVKATYRVNGRDGATRTSEGTSARNLVRLAGVGLTALVDMSVSFAGSSAAPVVLSADEVSGGFSGDPLGPRVATFDAVYSASEVHYFQPLRAPTDAQSYTVDPPGSTDLLVDLHTRGHRLTVRLVPSTSQTDAGQTVSFTAQVDPAPAEQVSYQWDFEGDRQPVKTQVPANSHVYAASGTFLAAVTVTTEKGSSGTDSAVIQVGHPAPGGTSTTPSPAAASLGGGGAPAGGGTPKNGGDSAGPTAPNAGPAHSRGTGSPAPPRNPAHPATHVAPVRARPVAPRPIVKPPPPPAPGGAAISARPKPANPGAAPGGTPVRGILLAEAGPLADALPALARATEGSIRPSVSRAAAGSSTGLLGWLTAVGLCLGLLLGGALRELRPVTRHAPQSV